MKVERSIFIETKEWVDTTYGNTYFASWVHVDGELIAVSPFQYGYGSQHEYEAQKMLGGLGVDLREFNPWSLRKIGVDLYTVKTPAKYRELKAWAKAGQRILDSKKLFAESAAKKVGI